MGAKILIAAGGTGGHIFPAIALGHAFAQHFPDVNYTFLCGERPLERRIYAENGINPIVFPARQLGSGIIGKLSGATAAAANCARAIKLIRREKFDIVVGMGGYVTGPAVLAGVILRRRTAIHEANSIPGKTNRYLAPYVDLCGFHFEATRSYLRCRRAETVGMPIREDIVSGSRDEAIRLFELDPERKTLLVLGGSQGAKYLYENLMQALPGLDTAEHSHMQILWSTGAGNFDELSDRLRAIPLKYLKVHLVPFISKMNHALAAADVALARAGASSCAELLANRVYALYVPFPSAIYDHQTLNAKEMANAGAGDVVPEKELTRDTAVVAISRLFQRAKAGEEVNITDSVSDSRHAARRLAELLLKS